jgi:hypothetical protein
VVVMKLRTKLFYSPNGARFHSPGEVANCRIARTREFISREGMENSSAKLYPPGTVLIAMIGEGKTRGQTAILDIEACTNQNASGLVFDAGNCVSEYVWYWALGEYERHRGGGRGGNYPALNGSIVRGFRLPLPPLAEQNEIVHRVDALFKLADAIERRAQVATARVERLTQAILAKAFRGELVPTEAGLARAEGREFEPAAVLLERIRAERAAAETNGASAPTRRPRRQSAPNSTATAETEPPESSAVPTSTPAEVEPAGARQDAATTNAQPPAIEDIDRNEVLATIRQVFSDAQARDREAAIQDIARALGYRRIGARIREVLTNDIQTAVRRGILDNTGGELSLLCRSIDDYAREHLVEMLLAAMGTGWHSRDDATSAAARHLGYRRTGAAIRAAFKSAINSAIRGVRLERDGAEMVRKAR